MASNCVPCCLDAAGCFCVVQCSSAEARRYRVAIAVNFTFGHDSSAMSRQPFRLGTGPLRSLLTIVALVSFNLANVAMATEPLRADTAMADRVLAQIPEIEAYIAGGMKGFDIPGLAVGIVAGDKLVYA